MKHYKIYVIRKKSILLIILFFVIFIALTFFICKNFKNITVNKFEDPKNRVIVIDPGHGGIDGGASKDGLLEKDVNLDISLKLKGSLLAKGYKIVMTREDDSSLEGLYEGSGSRHQKDLKARVEIINSSNAQLFVSVHCNCHTKNPNADGSIVLYSDKFPQNKAIAYCIQRSLNNIAVDGRKRTVHDPQRFANLLILNTSKIPGILVETAFLTNQKEHNLLKEERFKEQIADTIANGIDIYLSLNK